MLINQSILGSTTSAKQQMNTNYLDLNESINGNKTAHPLVAWYDFTDMSTMHKDAGSTAVTASGHVIGRIANKAIPESGLTTRLGVYLEQDELLNKPTFISDGTIAGTVGRFDGAAHYLLGKKDSGNANGTNSFSAADISGVAYTTFCVVKHDSGNVSANEFVYSVQDGAASFVGMLIRNVGGASDKWGFLFNDNVARVESLIDSGRSSSTDLTIVMSVSNHVSAGTSKCTLQGMTLGTTVGNGLSYTYDLGGNDADAGMMIGARTKADLDVNPNSYFDGDINEILIYNGKMPDESQALILSYLTSKYGITKV
tara:strand:+ start:1526 stop:2464 length:939 start_codon:yes stop_codon:yes gene_type:complete